MSRIYGTLTLAAIACLALAGPGCSQDPGGGALPYPGGSGSNAGSAQGGTQGGSATNPAPDFTTKASSATQSSWGIASWEIFVKSLDASNFDFVLVGVDATGKVIAWGEFVVGGPAQVAGKPLLLTIRSSTINDGPAGARVLYIAGDQSVLVNSLQKDHEAALQAGVQDVLAAIGATTGGTVKGQSVPYDAVGCILDWISIVLSDGSTIIGCAIAVVATDGLGLGLCGAGVVGTLAGLPGTISGTSADCAAAAKQHKLVCQYAGQQLKTCSNGFVTCVSCLNGQTGC